MALTPEQRAALRAEIEQDPAGRGYAVANPWAVFNKLHEEIPGAPVAGTRSITKVDAMQGVPGLLAVEIGWRAAAKADDAAGNALATYLTYWDQLPDYDFRKPLAGAIMDALAAAGIGFTAEMREALVALSTTSRAGPSASRAATVLPGVTLAPDDVHTVCAEIGG